MKIICVIPSLASGGAERQLSHLAVMLKRSGCEVKVAVWRSGDFFDSHLIENGVEIVRFPSPNKLSRVPRLIRLFRREKPSWVISYLTWAGIYCCIASFFCKFKLLVSERNHTAHWGPLQKTVFALYRRADYVVANSCSEEANIKEHIPSLTPKLRFIPNFVETGKFIPTFEQKGSVPRIIGVGRIAPQKNVKAAILAFSKVLETGRKCSFEWYGRDYDEKYSLEVRTLISDLGLEKDFLFMGENRSMENVYPGGDIFCLTSYREGYPNVVIEAMSCGLPVACSRVCDNPYIVQDGENGVLFDPRDIDDIAESLCRLIDLSLRQRQEIGILNREKVLQTNSEEAFLKAYLSLLR